MKKEAYELFLEVKEGNITPEEAQVELSNLLSDLLEENIKKEISDRKVYTGKDMAQCKLGLYKIYWESGGYSFASIGMTHSGRRWIAPSNWTNLDNADPTGRIDTQLKMIKRIVFINGNK